MFEQFSQSAEVDERRRYLVTDYRYYEGNGQIYFASHDRQEAVAVCTDLGAGAIVIAAGEDDRQRAQLVFAACCPEPLGLDD